MRYLNYLHRIEILTLAIIVMAWLVPTKISAQNDDGIVNISNFLEKGDRTKDATTAVRNALEYCKNTHAKKLIFPKGRYNFLPDQAVEKYVFTSNNDEGLKRIAFLLEGFENFEIDGQGSEFIFNGFISPFILENSKNITLRNFSIDWSRTFDSEGKILSVDSEGMELSFSEKYPYKIENGYLVFYGYGNAVYPYGGLLKYDSGKKEPEYMAKDYRAKFNLPAKEIASRVVKILDPRIKGKPGNVMVFAPDGRLCPAITISDSYNEQLNNIVIYHCGGMGIIAQRSGNIELNHIQIKPAEGRMVSLTADATHFVNCTGKIVMKNCLFENQLDDATNIHGIYMQIVKRISEDEVELAFKHRMQFGFDHINPGDTLELVHSNSLITYGKAVVKSVKIINKEYAIVKFTASLPIEMELKDVAAETDDTPDVFISGCTFRANRARGLLLGSRGKIVIEHNLFQTPGAAIYFQGDARFWFEQAGVRDVEIKENTFDNCKYGIWGDAIIQTKPGFDKSFRSTTRYNRNITIEDNTFKIFDPRILNIYSVDNLVFKNNIIEHTKAYPDKYPDVKEFEVSDCSHIEIEK